MSETARLSPDALSALYQPYFHPGTQQFPERFQRELTEICAAVYGVLLAGGGDALDLGANHGFHTLRMRKVMGKAAGRVIAVEGNASLAERLVGLAAGDSRITVLHKAVVASPMESVTFTTSKKYKALGSVMPNYIRDRFPKLYADAELETETVPAVTLDQLITDHRLDALRFVKCDVEGTDFEVMNSTRLVFEARAGVCVEMNFGPSGQREGPKLLAKLLEQQYHIFDCFMNRLDATTWYEPRRCPIDRFLLPAELGSETLTRITAAVGRRWEIYRDRPPAPVAARR